MTAPSDRRASLVVDADLEIELDGRPITVTVTVARDGGDALVAYPTLALALLGAGQ